MAAKKVPTTLGEIRARIEEVKDRIEELAEAHLTRDELRARIEHRVDTELAARPAVDPYRHLLERHPPRHKGLRERVYVSGSSSSAYLERGVEFRDLVLFLGRSALVDRLVDALADGCGELTAEALAAETRRLEKELAELELADAKLCVQLFDSGQPVPWREDCDIAQLLEAFK
ncbi:MAG TPA: hypothetical protein VF329_13545 [Gammaproteobacteria bacterium]